MNNTFPQKNKKNDSIIYGRNPILEALLHKKPIDRILMYHHITGEKIGDIIRLAKEQNIPLTRVPVQKLNQLTKGVHQGIIAFSSVVQYTPLQDIISHLYEQGETPLFMLLEGITDVRNTGAIIRTAVCYGYHAIIFTEKNAAPIHEDMVKTSAGALMNITFCREKNMQSVLHTLKMNGIRILSSSLQAKQNLQETDFRKPCCIVMGSESKGISLETDTHSDDRFYIPMVSSFDSLNVSVAAGIISYEIMKQRK